MAASEHILEFDAVEVYYGNVMALEKASLVVNQGEIVCLLGGNASGKTTTMKTILGVVTPARVGFFSKGRMSPASRPAKLSVAGWRWCQRIGNFFPALQSMKT